MVRAKGSLHPLTSIKKSTNFCQGDIIAVPASFVHGCYNNGDRSLITLLGTSSSTN
ncbi:hypothetical protein KSP40_PGU006396 [Platanthera guangdongensis]|uniref:Cupin type-1 domain-containing protein n=1 Tax=Platanthera guangdongensis TaxID=2320717 RepID=A0ABR2MZ42_9ASPA